SGGPLPVRLFSEESQGATTRLCGSSPGVAATDLGEPRHFLEVGGPSRSNRRLGALVKAEMDLLAGEKGGSSHRVTSGRHAAGEKRCRSRAARRRPASAGRC